MKTLFACLLFVILVTLSEAYGKYINVNYYTKSIFTFSPFMIHVRTYIGSSREIWYFCDFNALWEYKQVYPVNSFVIYYFRINSHLIRLQKSVVKKKKKKWPQIDVFVFPFLRGANFELVM